MVSFSAPAILNLLLFIPVGSNVLSTLTVFHLRLSNVTRVN